MKRKFPIGEYERPQTIDRKQLLVWSEQLAHMPARLKDVVEQIGVELLDKPYRENGWTRTQVVHHIADACMNSYIHFKLALTENQPHIKPYEEDPWVQMEDENDSDPGASIALLEAIVVRWTKVLRAMEESDFERTFVHPINGQQQLGAYLGFCVWHCHHHLAHIQLTD